MNRKQFATMLAVVAVAGLMGGALSDLLRGEAVFAQTEAAKVVKAEEFCLVDAEGDARALLHLFPNRTVGLALTHNDLLPRILMAVLPDGRPMLKLVDAEQNSRVLIVAMPDASYGLTLLDQNGKYRALLGVGADGNPGLQMKDDEQRDRILIGIMPSGSPTLRLLDETGKVVWSAP